MNGIRERLEQDLRTAVNRLRQIGGMTALEEAIGHMSDKWAFADQVDEIQANERLEIGFATRELLAEKVNRLAAALERLHAGSYGICGECEEPIAPARLRAMPEVDTCVRCQDRLERFGRRLETVEAFAGAAGADEEE